ncbi:unnamed protein product [Rotaria socialis]|uniref:Uncharacterized protein n=2 Tax=Rotaria socialis TaxID=392032 RepID=A0A818PMT5_9BILA|nr:unnamed protein product [Rotaria socialis]
MSLQYLPLLPNEIMECIAEKLSGIELFNFTVGNTEQLTISNHHLIQLLHSKSILPLKNEINLLINMYKSPYIIIDNSISVSMSSLRWNNFVYGAFQLNVIKKSLKYYSTNLFFLYSRLWSFTPFYYEASYPTVDLFQYTNLIEWRPLSLEENGLFKVLGTNQSAPSIVSNFNQFLENFVSKYDYDLWKDLIDWNLFIVAGGSIVSSLLADHQKENTSDIDLFFFKEETHLFKKAVNQLENRLQDRYFVRRRTKWPNKLIQFDLFRKYTISDILNGKTFIPTAIIQVIHPTMQPISISRILHAFDLDICSVAFDSKTIITTFVGIQALNTGHATCYTVPISKSHYMRRVPRYRKYLQRGFNIIFPTEFDTNTLYNTIIEDCKENTTERTYRFRRKNFGDNCDSFFIQKRFCEKYNLI